MSMAVSMLKYNRLDGYISARSVIRRINCTSISEIIEVFKNNGLKMRRFVLCGNLSATAYKFIRFNLLNTSRAWGTYLHSLAPLPPEL